jgi:adenylate cyclase
VIRRAARGFRPTLRLTISVVLAGMITITAGSLAVTSYLSTRGALLHFARDLIAQNAQLVREQVDGYLRPASSAAELTLALAQRGMVDVSEPERVEEYFFELLTVHRTVTMLNYGDEHGNFIMVKRQPDGSLSTKLVRVDGDGRQVSWRHRDPGGPLSPPREVVDDPDDAYDPRTRPWYRGAIADGGLHWTGVYVFHSDRQPGVTAAVPHRGPDAQLIGVLSVDIGLVDLSHFLRDRIRVGTSGQAFLVDEGKQLIAVSDADSLTVADGDGPRRLRQLHESPRPEIAALGAAGASRDLIAGAFEHGEPRTVRYHAAGRDYVATAITIDVGANRRWVAGVVALEDDFLAPAQAANRRALLAAAGFALIAVLIAIALSRGIARSLAALVDESGRVRRLELAPGGRRSTFREVDDVLGAFEGMKTGLRAFEKYVPMRLVRQLVERQQEPALGGEIRTLTILFTDVRGFAGISEKLAPLELAQQLGAYLSIVTRRIQERQGTVDKYVGDAVMAFWNAPQDVPDHPAEACRAALEALAGVRELTAARPDLPEFFTRIGIHTGEVVVGNFGSDDRLNYTIIGDGVNLASRLEGVNKLFGTQILISEHTRALLGDAFETRRLGLIAVKGRERPCVAYELIGEAGVDAARVAAARRYEQALDRYLARDFEAAAAQLGELLAEVPDDRAAVWLVEQCRAFAIAPPPAAWTGAVAMDTK